MAKLLALSIPTYSTLVGVVAALAFRDSVSSGVAAFWCQTFRVYGQKTVF